MASLIQPAATLADDSGQKTTITLTFDSILFTVLAVVTTNNRSVAVTTKLTNTGTGQTWSQTVNANSILSVAPVLAWTLNADRSMQIGWTFEAA